MLKKIAITIQYNHDYRISITITGHIFSRLQLHDLKKYDYDYDFDYNVID